MKLESDVPIDESHPAGLALLNEAIEGLQTLHAQSPADHVFFVADPSQQLLARLVPRKTLAIFESATAGRQLFLAAIAPGKIAAVLANGLQPVDVDAVMADLAPAVEPSHRHVALLLDDRVCCVVVEFGAVDPEHARAHVLLAVDDFGRDDEGEQTIGLRGAIKLMYNTSIAEMTERGRLHALWVQERGRAALELEAEKPAPREAGDVLIEACGGAALRTAWSQGLEAFVAYLDEHVARAVEQPQ